MREEVTSCANTDLVIRKDRKQDLESPEKIYGPEKSVVKVQSVCFEKLIISLVFSPKNQEDC